MTGVLERLREVNARRCARWHGPDTEPWTGADWSNAMCGEAGEAANVVKKLRRIETGTAHAGRAAGDAPGTGPDYEELVAALAHELADTVIYADLLAEHYGIHLPGSIVAKFNLVSIREGFPERLT